jgi:hypothetical protein
MPTIIVIGVTGAVAWPALFPEQGPPPSKGMTKPPPIDKGTPSIAGISIRDPFLVGGIPEPRTEKKTAPKLEELAKAKAKVEAEKKVEKPASLPPMMADDDQVLAGMKLGGVYIGSFDRIATIDDENYSPGEQLRKPDGSSLPYLVVAIGKDRVVLRRGRRDFVLGFSDVPTAVEPRVLANSAAAVEAGPAAASGLPAVTRSRGVPPRAPSSDTSSMLLRLLSALGGSSGGGGSGGADLGMLSSLLSGSGSSAGLGSLLSGSGSSGGLSSLLGGAVGSGTSADVGGMLSGLGLGGAGNVPVNQNTIQTGLDALSGKFDNVGQGGAVPGQLGGTSP